MMNQLTNYEMKMAILEILSGKRHLNKSNLLGDSYLRGDLETKLQTTFSTEERALAGEAFEQLRQAGLIRPSYQDFINPEDWFEITESGRKALELRALDDLDAALRVVHPNLCELRHGASLTLISNRPDSIRQAAHSTRELINQILNILAPIDEVKAQPDFQPSKESKSGVTRKMRIKHIIKKRSSGLSTSDADTVETSCQLVDQLYAKLSAEAHRDIRDNKRDVQDLILITETALRRLLL